MQLTSSLPKLLVLAVAILGIAIVGQKLFVDSSSQETVKVTVPQLSKIAQQGERLFGSNCSACHGANASGTNQGPPLVHKIYEPSHHADFSIVRAVRNGVRAHHWSYGNMAPITTLSEDEIGEIVIYIRELQRANGIF